MQVNKKNVIAILVPIMVLAGLVVLYKNKNRSGVEQKPIDQKMVEQSKELTKQPNEVATVDAPSGSGKRVQVKFFMEVNGIKYNDALYFSEEEYKTVTPERIEQMKMERFKAWQDAVNAQSNQAE
jgi:hypothetical protein